MRRKRITITIREELLNRLDRLVDGQKIKNRSNAIESIVQENLQKLGPRLAVLLVREKMVKLGGQEIPQVMLPIEGETLIRRNITYLAEHGVEEVVIAAFGDYKQQIEKALEGVEKMGIKVVFRQSKGSAGILVTGRDLLNEPFLMANGDILLQTIDLKDMFILHRKSQVLATITIAVSNEPAQLGNIVMKGNLVSEFHEKPADPGLRSYLINAGVYLLEPAATSFISHDGAMVEHDLFPVLAKLGKLGGYPIGRDWVHLHDADKYQEYMKSLK